MFEFPVFQQFNKSEKEFYYSDKDKETRENNSYPRLFVLDGDKKIEYTTMKIVDSGWEVNMSEDAIKVFSTNIDFKELERKLIHE